VGLKCRGLFFVKFQLLRQRFVHIFIVLRDYFVRFPNQFSNKLLRVFRNGIITYCNIFDSSIYFYWFDNVVFLYISE